LNIAGGFAEISWILGSCQVSRSLVHSSFTRSRGLSLNGSTNQSHSMEYFFLYQRLNISISIFYTKDWISRFTTISSDNSAWIKYIQFFLSFCDRANCTFFSLWLSTMLHALIRRRVTGVIAWLRKKKGHKRGKLTAHSTSSPKNHWVWSSNGAPKLTPAKEILFRSLLRAKGSRVQPHITVYFVPRRFPYSQDPWRRILGM
jgi:hypothetical protein